MCALKAGMFTMELTLDEKQNTKTQQSTVVVKYTLLLSYGHTWYSIEHREQKGRAPRRKTMRRRLFRCGWPLGDSTGSEILLLYSLCPRDGNGDTDTDTGMRAKK